MTFILDVDLDLETQGHSHWIPHVEIAYQIYIIHMVLNKFNHILVENDLHIGSKYWSWPWITKQISEMSSSAQLCIEKLCRT